MCYCSCVDSLTVKSIVFRYFPPYHHPLWVDKGGMLVCQHCFLALGTEQRVNIRYFLSSLDLQFPRIWDLLLFSESLASLICGP